MTLQLRGLKYEIMAVDDEYGAIENNNDKIKKPCDSISKTGKYKAILNMILLVTGLPTLFLIVAINMTGFADKNAEKEVEKEVINN